MLAPWKKQVRSHVDDRAVDDGHRIDLDAPIRRKGIGKPARVPFTQADTPAQRVR